MNAIIEGVSFNYPSGVIALKEVSLKIMGGEAVAIIGENGAGKTTLAKHLNGLLEPTEGRVLIGDWDTQEHTVGQLSKRVGFVFQNPDDQLFARSVRAEVAFGPSNLGLNAEEVEVRTDQALAQVGLKELAEHHPYDLHAATRKLVAIAATLAMGTPIVIFDEPTTGQDSRAVGHIGRLVEELKSEGRTVITISHDLDFCAEHSERFIVLSQGQVLADGPAERVLSHEEVLHEAGVEAPQMVRLAKALDLPSSPRTVENFVEAWCVQRRA
ncbi:MAG: ATP-binding cassette domain-containing protein [Anaerolineales bacterium]|nr:ATP-binding cassette domain-containing protein [Anaerolineales bacterium]